MVAAGASIAELAAMELCGTCLRSGVLYAQVDVVMGEVGILKASSER